MVLENIEFWEMLFFLIVGNCSKPVLVLELEFRAEKFCANVSPEALFEMSKETRY